MSDLLALIFAASCLFLGVLVTAALWPWSVILFIGLPTLMLALYTVGIQYERGGFWRLVLPVTAVALMLDVVMNYTVLAVIMWDWPRQSEYTFSVRLARLRFEHTRRGRFAQSIADLLNHIAPSGKHIT